MMDISIIIIVWNAKDILKKCLESIKHYQTNLSIETIVVDNASTDGAREMVENEYRFTRLIKNPKNYGYAKACNIGIEVAGGNYICILNSDIILLPGCLDSLKSFMDKNPSIGLSGPQLLNHDMSVRMNCKRFPTVWNHLMQVLGLYNIFPKYRLFASRHMNDFDHKSERLIDILAGSFWFVGKNALRKVGGLDENFFFYGEDIDLCKRFWVAGYKVAFFPGASAIHFHGESSKLMPLKFYIQQKESSLQYWRKHHSFAGYAAIYAITGVYEISRFLLHAAALLSRDKEKRAKPLRHYYCLLWLLGLEKGNK
jgi:GT2 family glycosyltransferase